MLQYHKVHLMGRNYYSQRVKCLTERFEGFQHIQYIAVFSQHVMLNVMHPYIYVD